MCPAARARGKSPWAPQRLPLRLQLLGERPCKIDLVEGGQRLDLVREVFHHARLPQADGGSYFGQAAEEWRVKDFMFRFAQSNKSGAEQPFRGRNIASYSGLLSFESQTTRIVAAQAVIFGIVF